MKRFALLALLVLGAFALAGSATAAGARGDDEGGGGSGVRSFGPYTIVTTDGGSCGNFWANDTIRRTYSVRSNGDGTYTIFETDLGAFTTIAGASPGACEGGSGHGTAVLLGKRGGLVGYLTGTVSCAGPCVLDPTAASACQTPVSACTRDVFVAAAFGPTAHWSCLTGTDPCRFRFDYFAQDQGLIYHHWVDEGTATSEHFSGDIASA